MKKAAALALLAALTIGGVSAAESADGVYRPGYRYAPRAYHWRHAPHVYSVYRGPRFVPPPAVPQPFFFRFVPTDRVNTHMY